MHDVLKSWRSFIFYINYGILNTVTTCVHPKHSEISDIKKPKIIINAVGEVYSYMYIYIYMYMY